MYKVQFGQYRKSLNRPTQRLILFTEENLKTITTYFY